MEFETLEALLVFFAFGGGSQWLMGVLQARLLENWVFWHSIPAKWKKLITIALSGIIGFGFNILIEFDVVSLIPAFLLPILLAGANWIFSQKEYGAIKEGEYGDRKSVV